MNIDFGGHQFLLHPSGILFWPDRKMLIVSDLHLEKGSHFAKRGFFLPPYDSRATLSLLYQICDVLVPSSILILGDGFHDNKAFERMGAEEKALFLRLHDYETIWIKGNHDDHFFMENFDVKDTHSIDGLYFTHEASAEGRLEVSGHFHPKARIGINKSFLSCRCFIEDGNKFILPAFGAYTGGLDVSHAAIAAHFPKGGRLYGLGTDKIYYLGFKMLCD